MPTPLRVNLAFLWVRTPAGERRGLFLPEAFRLLGILALLGPHLAFRIAFYGGILPNTFYAKVILSRAAIHAGLALKPEAEPE